MFGGVGDGSDGNQDSLRAQDLDNPNGKILRIRTDGTALPDNPFYDGTNSWRSKVWVYGVDERFARFHGLTAAGPFGEFFRAANSGSRNVLLSPALAREIGAALGGTVLIRVQRPSDIPLESLHGRKDDLGRTVRLTVRGIPSAAELGEFSLQPHQGDVRAGPQALQASR